MVAPLCIDGVVYSSSMVLLNDARRGLDAHWLAYLGLGLRISATLAINVLSGLPYGIFGAVVAAWPAVALVLSYELLMIIVRRSAIAAPEARSQCGGLAWRLPIQASRAGIRLANLAGETPSP